MTPPAAAHPAVLLPGRVPLEHHELTLPSPISAVTVATTAQ